MIILAGEIKLKAGKRDEAVQVVLPMMAASQAEAGCIAYEFSAHLADPDVLLLYEAWQDAESLAIHGKSAHMATFREKFPALVDGEINLSRYQAEPIAK